MTKFQKPAASNGKRLAALQQLRKKAEALAAKKTGFVSWKYLLDNHYSLVIPINGVFIEKPPNAFTKFPMRPYLVDSYMLLDDQFNIVKAQKVKGDFTLPENGGEQGVNYFEMPSNDYFRRNRDEMFKEGKAHLLVITNYVGMTGKNGSHMYDLFPYEEGDDMIEVFNEAVKG